MINSDKIISTDNKMAIVIYKILFYFLSKEKKETRGMYILAKAY